MLSLTKKGHLRRSVCYSRLNDALFRFFRPLVIVCGLSEINRDITDKRKELYDAELNARLTIISYNVDERRRKESLAAINNQIKSRENLLAEADEELDKRIAEATKAARLVEQMKAFVETFRIFAPSIEEYANHVEGDRRIEAGNSFRGVLNELGRLLESFKEVVKEGLCWFPQLMRWNTSKGEVSPVFEERNSGYDYVICGYMNVKTRATYSKSELQTGMRAEYRVGTMEQMDVNIAAMEKDIQEILRLSEEQERL